MRAILPGVIRAGKHGRIPKARAGNILTSSIRSFQRVAWDLVRFPPMKPRGNGALRLIRAGGILAAMVFASSASAANAFRSRDLAPDPAWQATRGSLATTGSGLTAGLANPAGAFGLERAQAAFSHLIWAGDLSREWAALGAPLGSRVGFVVDAALLHGPQLMGYDADGVETGSFRVTEWNAGGSFGTDVGRGLSLGLGARVHRLEDPNEPVTGIGFAAGAQWQLGAQSFGFSITDAGSARAGGTDYELPTHWRAGVEREATLLGAGYRAGASVTGGESSTVLALGLILQPTRWVSLMGGFSNDRETDSESILWSSGIQVEHQGILVGYAVHPAGFLGTTHQFSLTVPLRGESASLISGRTEPR